MLIKDERKSVAEQVITEAYITQVERLGDYIWLSLNTGYSVRLSVQELKELGYVEEKIEDAP